MSHYLVKQIEGIENIELLTHTEVHQVSGSDKLETLTLYNNQSEETYEVPAGGLFVFIGAQPHTDMVEGIVQRNRAGFIPTGAALMRRGKRPQNWALQRDPYLLETNVPGIFAVGDVREFAIRRVATAVGEGAVAVNLIHQYLRTV
jgi:thioredoxin reductase (NADPH)